MGEIQITKLVIPSPTSLRELGGYDNNPRGMT